jgi:hypothetical protein
MAYIGVSPSNGVRQKHTYTATANQTSFSGVGAENVTLSYKDSNYVDVYRNGVKLGDEDYTSTSGTAIVLAEGAAVNDIVEIIVYDVFSIADAVSKSNGGQFDGDVIMAGTLGVTGVLTGTSLDISGDVDVDGTLEADAITLNGTAIGSIYSPIAGGTGILTTGALNAGSITSGFGTIDNGASAITSTGVGSFGSLDISGDIDVDGTTNLDVVDIDGAVDMASTLTVAGTLSSAGGLVHQGDANTSLDFGTDQQTFYVGGVRALDLSTTGTVFNEAGADVDFRVESDTIDHALFVDGANGNVGIGQASPASKIHASGAYPQVQVDDTASRNFALGVTSSSFRIRDVTGSADRLTIDANGNVLASNGTITATRAGADQNILGEATTAGYASRLQLKAANYSGGSYNAIQSFQGDVTPAWEISGAKINATNVMMLSTGGTERMRIDSSGYVTQSKLPMFSAHGGNTHAVATSGVFTYTSANVYQSTEYDPDSLFNASNGRFTAPVAGRYFFIFSIGVTFTSGYHYSYIRKNDADIAGYTRNSAQGSQHITQVIQGIINLASGDYVTTARNNNNIDGSVGWAMFQGFLLG